MCHRLIISELHSDAAAVKIVFLCFAANLLPAVCVYHAITSLLLVGYQYLNSSVCYIAFDKTRQNKFYLVAQ